MQVSPRPGWPVSVHSSPQLAVSGHSDFGFAIFNLRMRKLYSRKAQMKSGGLPGRSSKFYSGISLPSLRSGIHKPRR